MTQILEVLEDEARVSHRVVAQYTDKQEVAIANIINKYKDDIEDFGRLHFKNEVKKSNGNGGLNPKTYYLNEAQSTFLMTLLRNKPIVIEFKKKLVQEFYKLKEHQTAPRFESPDDMMGVVLKLVENQQRQTDAILELVSKMDGASNQGRVPMPTLDMPDIGYFMSDVQKREIRQSIEDRAKDLAHVMSVTKKSVVTGIWTEFKHFFDLTDYTKLKASSFSAAMNWISFYDPRVPAI